jgi:hypothetical protein
VQSAHVAPVAPQAVLEFPVTQVPGLPEQQPRLHGVSPATPHCVVHWWFVELHVCPGEQSDCALQPHVPAGMHA